MLLAGFGRTILRILFGSRGLELIDTNDVAPADDINGLLAQDWLLVKLLTLRPCPHRKRHDA